KDAPAVLDAGQRQSAADPPRDDPARLNHAPRPRPEKGQEFLQVRFDPGQLIGPQSRPPVAAAQPLAAAPEGALTRRLLAVPQCHHLERHARRHRVVLSYIEKSSLLTGYGTDRGASVPESAAEKMARSLTRPAPPTAASVRRRVSSRGVVAVARPRPCG